MTAPKTRLSITLHSAPCTIPYTNPLNKADFATIRERFIKIDSRVIEHIARNGPRTSPNRVGEFGPHPRRVKRARHVRYRDDPPTLPRRQRCRLAFGKGGAAGLAPDTAFDGTAWGQDHLGRRIVQS